MEPFQLFWDLILEVTFASLALPLPPPQSSTPQPQVTWSAHAVNATHPPE